jgi:hypothetical protein
MAVQTPSLSNGTIRRLIIALADQKAGNEVLGSLGQLGGFRLGASAAIASSSGDCVAIPDSGGAPGTYRVLFPNVNANIQSIAWFEVLGFTPRTPTGVETAVPLVCGYNLDTTRNQWYITVQIVSNTTYAVLSSPPTGFVVGVRAAFTFNPTANAL